MVELFSIILNPNQTEFMDEQTIYVSKNTVSLTNMVAFASFLRSLSDVDDTIAKWQNLADWCFLYENSVDIHHNVCQYL